MAEARPPTLLTYDHASLPTDCLTSRAPTGHINHSLFWKNLTPAKQGGGRLKDGKLKAALERDFGSVDAFKTQFNAATAGIQGSGWGWLGYNSKAKVLEIVTTPNQDPLLSALPLLFFFSVPFWFCSPCRC
jgi:superoxide dismutase